MKARINQIAVTSYLETLLWSETAYDQVKGFTISGNEVELEADRPLDSAIDVSDLPGIEGGQELIDEARTDLEDFQAACLEAVGVDPFAFFDAQDVAHDFALSRNGHGAGFFDGNYSLSTSGPGSNTFTLQDELQKVARHAGTCGLDVWVNEGDPDAVIHIASHG